jgi:DNA polymerase
MPTTGEGRLGILIVAEAPGATEDATGIQLVGDAGKKLRGHLDTLGVDLDGDCWKTNAVVCRPPDNRKPKPNEINACRPNLFAAINEYKPSVIIPMGQTAVDGLLATVWGGEIGPVEKWVGWAIPCGDPNAWIVPTWHPSFLLRSNQKVLDLLFKKHLQRAIALAGSRPNKPRDYASIVRVEMRPNIAAKLIKRFLESTKPVAFDFECTALKPETKGARILACSLSDGQRAISYPWHGEAIAETIRFLQSPVPKIGANIQYEERWAQVHAGGPVNAWLWDTMLAAHVLDNRPEICSLKFQSFIRFGVPYYAGSVDTHMGTTKNGLNTLTEVPLKDLLLYNGMDGVLTWDVAQQQMQEFDN